MHYKLTTPCPDCPFLAANAAAYGIDRLEEFASGEFPCHKTAELVEVDDGAAQYHATRSSQHCAGALIYLEKQQRPHQMMRIAERLGMYDARQLDMNAPVA